MVETQYKEQIDNYCLLHENATIREISKALDIPKWKVAKYRKGKKISKASKIKYYLLNTTLCMEEITKRCDCKEAYVRQLYSIMKKTNELDEKHFRERKHDYSEEEKKRKEIVNYIKEHPNITLQKAGDHFGITRERVRQVLNKENENIKNFKNHDLVNKEIAKEINQIRNFCEENRGIFKTQKELINAYNFKYPNKKITYNKLILYKISLSDYFPEPMSHEIIKLLKETKMRITEIAKKCNTSIGYVYQVNKKYNARG